MSNLELPRQDLVVTDLSVHEMRMSPLGIGVPVRLLIDLGAVHPAIHDAAHEGMLAELLGQKHDTSVQELTKVMRGTTTTAVTYRGVMVDVPDEPPKVRSTHIFREDLRTLNVGSRLRDYVGNVVRANRARLYDRGLNLENTSTCAQLAIVKFAEEN